MTVRVTFGHRCLFNVVHILCIPRTISGISVRHDLLGLNLSVLTRCMRRMKRCQGVGCALHISVYNLRSKFPCIFPLARCMRGIDPCATRAPASEISCLLGCHRENWSLSWRQTTRPATALGDADDFTLCPCIVPSGCRRNGYKAEDKHQSPGLENYTSRAHRE